VVGWNWRKFELIEMRWDLDPCWRMKALSGLTISEGKAESSFNGPSEALSSTYSSVQIHTLPAVDAKGPKRFFTVPFPGS